MLASPCSLVACSELHCLVALDEADVATAAVVASDRLQLCLQTAKMWLTLKDAQRAEVHPNLC